MGRKARISVRRELAERDGTFIRRVTPSGASVHTRCAVCGQELPLPQATIGHIQALRNGGTNAHSNLRLECELCNQEDAWRLDLKPEQLTPEEMERRRKNLKQKLEARELKRKKWASRKVYDSVKVLDIRGNPIAHTSLRRARLMLRDGVITLMESDESGNPRVLRLNVDKPIVAPHDQPIENKCVACGDIRGLTLFRFWPDWHPTGRGLRKTKRTAALCPKCYSRINRRFTEALLAAAGGPVPRPNNTAINAAIGSLLAAYNRLRHDEEWPLGSEARVKKYAGIELSNLVRHLGADDAVRDLRRRITVLQRELKGRERLCLEEERRRIVQSELDLAKTFWNLVASASPQKPERA